MLNNEERLAKLKDLEKQDVSVMQERTTNDVGGLNFVVPTEFVDLPSRGLYYKEGHPLYGKASIEIKQMTTKEEDILTNRSLIKKGIVIDKLLESVIVDKSISPSSLLVGDRNAIILAARASGYGENYDILINCNACGTKKSVSLNLYDFVKEQDLKVVEKFKTLKDSNILENGNIVFELPKSKWLVECRPLTGKDELYLINLAEMKKKSSLAEDVTIVEQMCLMIETIQMVDDRSVIMEAVRKMPASDAKYLRKKYQESMPVFDMKIDFSCDVCNNSQEAEVGFNQEFFWPK